MYMKTKYVCSVGNGRHGRGSQKTETVVGNLQRLAAATVLALLVCGVAPAQTIQRVSASGKFYVDDKASAGLLYNYAAYLISNNTASTLSNVYVVSTNFISTNLIQLGETESGVRALGAILPGQSKMAAFYLKGPSLTGNSQTIVGLTNENHTIRVLNGAPGIGSVLVSANFGFTNIIYATEALANKVTLITNLNPVALLGSQVVMVIAGDTGTIGGQNSIAFSPAILGSWRADSYQLVGAKVTFTENPTYTDRLYFDPSVAGFTNFSGQSYSNAFIYQAVAVTGTNIAISPFAYVDSGNGTKHTAFSTLASAGGSNVIYSATNTIAIVNQTVTPSSLLAPGGPVTYSVTISNYANVSINLTEIIDTLPGIPGNVTYVPGSATYNAASISDPNIIGQVLRWAQPFLVPSNNFSVLTFQAIAPAPAGNYTNSVIARNGVEQVDTTTITTDNSPSLSVFTIIPVSDIAVGKTGPGSVVAAANFGYTISVTNLGPSPASGLSVTDSLPVNVAFVSASGGGVLNGGQVIWTGLPTLPANSSTNFTVTVTAPAEGTTLTNSASGGSSILDLNPTNNASPPVITTVIPSADVGVTKSGPAAVNVGANFAYTITVANFGPSTATGLSVTDNLPAGVTFVSATAGGVLSGGGVIWSNLGNLAAGSSTNLTLTVTAPVSNASLTNTASVVSPVSDPNSTNNTSPPVVTGISPVADVVVSKSAPINVNLGASFDYTISVTNLGPSTASSLSVTDSLPSGVTFVSASGGGVLNGSQVLWTNFNLVAGAATNFTLTVTAPVVPSSLTNIASVVATNADPNLTNNTTPPVVTSVGALADLAVSKSTPPVVNAGANFNYTITVTNLGPTAASSVTVTDNLPASVTFVSASAGGVLSGAQVIWTDLGLLAAGASTNLTLTVSAPASAGSLTNTASVGSPTPDPVQINNITPPVITSVTPVADLNVTKTGPVTSPLPGANFNYTITVSNLGPSIAVSVAVTDALPANLSFVSASGGGVFSSGNVIWGNLGNLAAGAFTNLTLTVTAPLKGGITNTASVSSPTSDPNSTNNVTPPVTSAVSNVPPVAVNDTFTTLEDTPLAIPAGGVLTNDFDANADALTALLVANVAHGTLILNADGSFTYTPSPNYNGSDSFTYRATDGQATSAVATVTINITPVNDAPVANDDAYSLFKNATLIIPAPGVLTNDTDVDGDTLTVVPASGTAHGSLVLNANGGFTYTPVSNYVGSDSFTYQASDGITNSGLATVTLTILPTNTPPTAIPQTVSTFQNASKAITLTGSDPDGNPLTFSIATPPANGTLSGFDTNTGAITYSPNPSFVGNDSFTFRVNDGMTDSAPATVTINVGAQADIAVFKTGSTNGGAGTNLFFTITVTNLGPSTASNVVVFDQLPAKYTFVSAVPAAASVVSNLVTWPAFDLANSGSSNFVLTVTPSSGGVFTNVAYATSSTPDPDPTNNNGTSTNSWVTSFVQPLADVLVFKAGAASVAAGGSLIYTIVATNQGALTATNVVVTDNLPAGATFQNASGSFSVSNGVVTWAGLDLANGASVTYTLLVTAPLSGYLTNSAASTSSTPDPDPSNNDGTSPLSRVITSVSALADVAVFKSGPTSVVVGASFAYTITVTNLGPSAAGNVIVSDILPTNFVFVGASSGGVLAGNVVTWPAIGSLANGDTTNYTLTVAAPVTGNFTNVALAISSTADPNPSNNDGSAAGSRVATSVVSGQFGVTQGTNWLNSQTGLFEQRVTVTNNGSTTVAAFRLLVGNISSTNGVPRTNVFLYNATGTNVDSRPYVQYNSPLDPGSNATLILEFYVPDRKPFTNSLEVLSVLPSMSGTNSGPGVMIDREFMDMRFTPARFVIEWTSVPGTTYTIIYSDVGPTGPWLVATPTITANANRVQWYDDGPPKTASQPASVSSRYYRVIANP